VYCWGDTLGLGPVNLGNGPVYYSPTAIAVPGITDATEIAVGGDHACVIIGSGDVWCWGADSVGQIGHGDPTGDPPSALRGYSLPVAVPGLHDATSIASGLYHSCATLHSGQVWCWGANNAGQLGNDTEPPTSFVPVEVTGISNAARVVANADHTCALLTTGAIRCWGDNSFGALGDGTTHNSPTPVAVVGITHAVQIDLGEVHTCALLADGRAQCWGYNHWGELGDGTTRDSSVPVTVSGIVGARAVSAAQTGTCVIVSDGRVLCWGEGTTGQLGDGKWESSITPVEVAGIEGATAITGHVQTKCVAVAHDSLRCWGWNMAGSLGNGDPNAHSDTPVAVIGYP
jgi:alpha-tubulin suppressor-like RCC1 family protein